MADRVQLFALPSVPGTVATSAGIITRMTFHSTATAWEIAGLAGLLALIAVFAVSSESQKTLRLWIRHRAEHRIAAATSFEIRRRARTATCGRRWTKASARDIRQAAATLRASKAGLPEVMMITRLDRLEAPGRDLKDEGKSSSVRSNANETHAPLEIVQEAIDRGTAKSASL